MHTRLENLKNLRMLYLRKSLGEAYGVMKQDEKVNMDDKNIKKSDDIKSSILNSLSIKECNLCPRIKQSTPITGISGNSRIAFVTQMPLWNDGIIEQNRRAQMLMDIKNRVFDGVNVDFFSFVKCGQTLPQKEEIEICFVHLENELSRSLANIVICFGGVQSLAYFGFKDSMLFGKILDYKNKQLIITHPLRDLVRNPSLKRETYGHLLIAKGAL